MPAPPTQAVQPAEQGARAQTVTDPKELLGQATVQVEQIVVATPLSPSDRAIQIQAVKAAYIKARYNLEIPTQEVQ